MRRYKPIKIHDNRFGYGYWWGKYCFFVGKHSACFAIVPIWDTLGHSIYASNCKIIKHGDSESWSPERQKEYREDKR
jgi:hypothetical protein